ncbi:hypothetical protein AB4Z13_10000, partial [Rhizobium sp. YAF28]|uniref:hypothetical protein n=1 Tax=Rhizobium sp. YAF28 TaxID=3233081 RepID=UPI003F9AECA7
GSYRRRPSRPTSRTCSLGASSSMIWCPPILVDTHASERCVSKGAPKFALTIDQKEHSNKIDDEIIAEIRRSKFLIADFTCGLVGSGEGITAIPRGGVYYEAGFAQGLGIPVIWCCREDHINHVHFDTRQFNHITWKTPEELREKLKNRISAVLGDGPLVSH